MYHILFTQPSVGGHLDCFHLLAILTVAMNICVQVVVWTHVFISLGYVQYLRVELAAQWQLYS